MFSLVEISKIEVPKKWRSLKKTAVASLAESLLFDGLLQPVGVRPHPKKEGFLELVYGRHRLEAAKSLGWTQIDAKYLAFDDGAAASATNAENLFRNELSAGERVVAFKSQKERYIKLHPDADNKRAGGIGAARARAGDDTEKTPSFAEYSEATTGVPVKTVERYVSAGTNLTEEQLGVLAENPKVTLTDIKAINKLDESERSAVVNMIAVGVTPKESIAQATTPAGSLAGEPVNDDGQAEEDMTDETWLDTYCGEVLARLKYTAPFKRDAILYRQTRDARHKFRGALKKPLAQSKIQIVGPFYRLLAKTVNVDHPSRWLPCGPCGGSGMDGNKSKCHNCRGDAYVVKTAGGSR